MSDLVADVLSNVRNGSGRNPSWFDRLPPEAQAELKTVREQFDPAVHQKVAFARAVIAAAQKRGWTVAKERQVMKWLLGDL
jgi:hypothetical protein